MLSFYRSDWLQGSAVCGKENCQQLGKLNFRGCLVKLNVFTSMRLDESALMEVCGGIVGRLPVIYKKLLVSDLCPPSGVSKIYMHLKKGEKGHLESSGGQPHLRP